HTAMSQANQITSQASGYQIDTNKSSSAEKSAQKNYRLILPRAPFQQLNR
ncbi:15919_t:CDS:1, partial [Cetraspora pellucida]